MLYHLFIFRPDGFMYDQFRNQFTLYTCYTSKAHFNYKIPGINKFTLYFAFHST